MCVCENCNLRPWKKSPLFPSNPFLKVEVLPSPPFLKIWLEVQPPPLPPPAEREGGGGCTLCRYGIGGEISATIFQLLSLWIISKKNWWQKFWKNLEKTTLGPFWDLFAQIWVKMNFPGKMGSVGFQIFQSSTFVPKTWKN